MNAEQLIGRASARGIDLVHAAGAAINELGIARKRALTDIEKKLGIPDVRETAAGHETRTYRRPAFSLAELGQAAVAGGVHGTRWLAIRYSIAGDSSCIDELRSSLTYRGHLISRRESWAPQVVGLDGRRHFFRERLADLVLTEDSHRHYFAAAPALYAICMDVPPTAWAQTLNAPFRSLKTVYEGWLTDALAALRRGMRGD